MSVGELEYRREDEHGRPVPEPAPEGAQTIPAQVASAVGNEAFGRVARGGAGILPDGRAHPDVEATIAQTRGGGHALDDGARDRLGEALGDPLSDVRVHTDETADALASRVRATATGCWRTK
jgi:Domain of unknown function (DUF4157)